MVSVRAVKRDEDFGELNFGLHGMRGNGTLHGCEKTRGQLLPFPQLAPLLRNVPRAVQAGVGRSISCEFCLSACGIAKPASSLLSSRS